MHIKRNANLMYIPYPDNHFSICFRRYAYLRASQDLQKQDPSLFLGYRTGEGIYFVRNLRLSAFKASQRNNSPKSQSLALTAQLDAC